MSRICCQEDTAYAFAMRQRVRKPRGPPRFGQGSRAPSSLWRVAPATPHTPFGSASSLAVPDRGIGCARRLSSCRARVDRRASARFAFRRCRLPLPPGALFGPEGAACGRVDAFVAVVPADPIARRWVPSQHLFNDTGAGSAVG
jgi:hypothetical protein